MLNKYKWGMLLFAILLLQACAMPRLGVESVRYGGIIRQPVEYDRFIHMYSSREDVPFVFIPIGEVTVAPVPVDEAADYDPIEYDPIALLRKRTREMGGIALVDVKRGTGPDSRYVWKGVVITRKEIRP